MKRIGSQLGLGKFALLRCPFCVTYWVDNASAKAGLRLPAEERLRLVVSLLSRRHLIFSGPAGAGKCRLAHALALSISQGRKDHVCLIQGHPWWAARTGSVGRYVRLQTEFSAWRLVNFMESVLDRKESWAEGVGGQGAIDYVVCVERMSPIEIDFYFDRLSQGLLRGTPGHAGSIPIRLLGTYDGNSPPTLNRRILRSAALLNLGTGILQIPTS